MFKNVASQQIVLLAIDTATNTPKTGDAANITAYLSKDYGTVTVLGDTTATEMDATNAPGLYRFDVTQTESNCDVAVFSAKSSTSGIRIVPVTVFMRPANMTAMSIDSNGRLDMAKLAGQTITAGAGVTFPSSIASPTNITAATGIVLSGVTHTGAVIPTVTTVGTLTTYTGNTPQTGDAYARLGAPAGASVSADVAAVKTDTGNLVTRITSTLFSGITQLSKWLGALAGKTADASTLTEINATTAGAGYNNTTDSQEALRDRGDASWITATSVTVSDKTGFKLASDGLAAVTSWTVGITGNITGNLSGSVGSVSGAVGSVTGAVGSVTAAVTVGTNNDKTGYSLATAPPTAAAIATQVWTDLTSGSDFATATSVGKLLKDNIDATVSSRLASGSYTAPPSAATISTQVQTDLGTGAALTSLASQSSVNTLTAYVDTEVAAILDAVATTGVVLSAAQMNKIADHVLRRQMANVEASSNGDTLSLSSQYGAIQQIQESAVVGTTLTVNKTDGTTALGTKTVATASGADAITGIS